jgi:hypothetical protein
MKLVGLLVVNQQNFFVAGGHVRAGQRTDDQQALGHLTGSGVDGYCLSVQAERELPVEDSARALHLGQHIFDLHRAGGIDQFEKGATDPVGRFPTQSVAQYFGNFALGVAEQAEADLGGVDVYSGSPLHQLVGGCDGVIGVVGHRIGTNLSPEFAIDDEGVATD